MKVKIYIPAKTAMQSGLAKTHEWLLEFERGARQNVDSLMGWSGQSDTTSQLNLWFATADEAVAYAKKHGLDFEVIEPKIRKQVPKAYADNFKFDKVEFQGG